MKKILLFILVLSIFTPFRGISQLDGSGIAPNFTLTDINSTTHTLYDYLDNGKVVVLDFFATWCGPCNNNADAVETVWNTHGTSGDNTIMMFLMESSSSSNLTDLQTFMTNHGVTCPTFNLVETTGVPGLYEITYFPTYYIVYPDRSYKQVSGEPATIASVMNAAIAENSGLSTTTFDAKIVEFDQPSGTYCSDSIRPIVTLQNYGTEVLTSCQIKSKIDGNLIKTYNWTGSLAQYEIESVELEDIIDVVEGTHTFTFEVQTPNGETDVDVSNNSKDSKFTIIINGTTLTVSIKTDDYPTETSWAVLFNEEVLTSGGGFKNANATYIQEVCIYNDSCYTFEIYDSYGDGNSNKKAEISINGYVLGSITNFSSGTSKSIDFCAIMPKSELTFDPENGATDIFLDKDISISFSMPVRLLNDNSITDPSVFILFKKDNNVGSDVPFTATIDDQKKLITVSSIENMDPNQVYYISIDDLIENNYDEPINEAGITFSTGTTTGINEIICTLFNIYPNPASERITLEFNLKENSNIRIEIYNESGQLVQLMNKENLNSGNNNINLDVSKLNSGLYFMNLISENESITQKIQIIK